MKINLSTDYTRQKAVLSVGKTVTSLKRGTRKAERVDLVHMGNFDGKQRVVFVKDGRVHNMAANSVK